MMIRAILTAVLLVAIGPVQASADSIQPDDVAAARAIVKDFAGRLQGALKAAIKEGGFEQAIGVCNEAAPQIAETVSKASGWRVARTALRVRNPANAPSEREAAVLEGFIERAEAGEDLKTMEHRTVFVDAEGRRMLHYMKAIPLGEVCANCHGTTVDPQLYATIRGLYPEDQAVGFRPGELRGAFTLTKALD